MGARMAAWIAALLLGLAATLPAGCLASRPGAGPSSADDSLNLEVSDVGSLAVAGRPRRGPPRRQSAGGRGPGPSARVLLLQLEGAPAGQEGQPPNESGLATEPLVSARFELLGDGQLVNESSFVTEALAAAVALLVLACLVWCCWGALSRPTAWRRRPGEALLEGCVRLLHAGDEASAQVAGTVAWELEALGCTVAGGGAPAGADALKSVDLVLCILTPTLLAIDAVRMDLAAFQELGVSVIPVHSGDQFPRDELTPMIGCSASELLGRELVEESEEANVMAVRKYLFGENIRDVSNESHAEACRATIAQLALRAAQVHACRAEGVPAGHYKHDVFISYHAKDAWDVYESVAAVFEGLDLDVFNPSKDLQMTQVSLSEMVRHVKGSDCVLQVLSPNYPLSKWCRAELFAAEEAGISTYVVYASKKHSRAHLMNLLSAPAELGSQDEEAVNLAKAAIRRAAELRGMTDVYNPDFADNVADRLQAIAVEALPTMRRRLVAARVLRWVAAILMMMAIICLYILLNVACLETYCAKSDIGNLERSLKLTPWSPDLVPMTRCLTRLKLKDTLDEITSRHDVGFATKEILPLVTIHQGDWEMMILVLLAIEDMVWLEPGRVAADARVVDALVETAGKAMDSYGDKVDASPDQPKEALEAIMDSLVFLAYADTRGNVLRRLPSLMPRLLELYWNDFEVARPAVELPYGLTIYWKQNGAHMLPKVGVATFLSPLLAAMRKYPDCGEMQEQGALLLLTAAETPEVGDAVEDITKVLLDALDRHAARVAVRNRVLQALEAFSRKPLGAAAICRERAVESALRLLATVSGSPVQLALSVMRIVNATAGVRQCLHQVAGASAVAAFNRSLTLSLTLSYGTKELALLACMSLGRLAELPSSRRDIVNTTLSVVLTVSRRWDEELDISVAVATLLNESAEQLWDASSARLQDEVVSTLLRLLHVHLEQSGSQRAAPLLASTVAAVSAMSTGNASNVREVSQYLVWGLGNDSTTDAAELVMTQLRDGASSLVGPLFKRLMSFMERSCKPAQCSAAIRVMGKLSGKFPIYACDKLTAIIPFVAAPREDLQEAAKQAVLNISTYEPTVAIQCIRGAFDRDESLRGAAVEALQVIGEHALKTQGPSGLHWDDVDTEFRKLAGLPGHSFIWSRMYELWLDLPDDALIPWLKLALQKSVGDAARSVAERIVTEVVRRGGPEIRGEAATVLRASFADKLPVARSIVVRCWARVAKSTEVERGLPDVLNMVDKDVSHEVQVQASLAAVKVLPEASALCADAVAVLDRFLDRNSLYAADRQVVMQAFRDQKGTLPPGPCRNKVSQLLSARNATDASSEVRELAGQILRSKYCPTTATGCMPEG